MFVCCLLFVDRWSGWLGVVSVCQVSGLERKQKKNSRGGELSKCLATCMLASGPTVSLSPPLSSPPPLLPSSPPPFPSPPLLPSPPEGATDRRCGGGGGGGTRVSPPAGPTSLCQALIYNKSYRTAAKRDICGCRVQECNCCTAPHTSCIAIQATTLLVVSYIHMFGFR